MTANKVLICLVFITLLSTVNSLCLLGISINLLCGTLLGGLLCNKSLNNLLGTCSFGEAIDITLDSNKDYVLKLDATHIASLSVTATGSATIFLDLGLGVTIDGDLTILGATVNIGSGVTINVGGNVVVGQGSTLLVAGILNVRGVTNIQKGHLDFMGSMVHGSAQNAWVNSSVSITGTSSAPASITGNGGINGNVTMNGNVSTGTPASNSEIYISKGLTIAAGAFLKLAGNVTANGGVQAFGRLHLDGVLTPSSHQYSWLTSSSVHVSGAPGQVALLTGNGGIEGDVYLDAHSKIAAGNSPGTVSIGGNLIMYSGSMMEIEVASTSSFDRYVISKTFNRNGYLYTIFINNFVPSSNDRFSFVSHQNANGIFISGVETTYGDVLAAYSNRSTMFIFDDPQQTSYCSCVFV